MLQFLTAIDELHEIIAVGAVLAVCALAIGLGTLQQKLAGVVQFVDAFGLAIFSALLARPDRVFAIDGKALFVLAAYCALTIRWRDRLLIVLTGLQAFAVMLHLSVWLDNSILAPVNGLLLNITGWTMLAVLAVATLFSRRPPGTNRPVVDHSQST